MSISPVYYVFTSAQPIYVKNDVDELEFLIRVGGNKDDVSVLKPFVKNLKVEGGLKLDFSVGLVTKFISDDKYFFATDGNLQQRDKSEFFDAVTPGIASMMHFYRRTHKDVAFGGMFGINADLKELTDVNLGFLAGASAILGRSHKVIVSTGISYSKVNRLKEGEFKVGTAYKDTKIDDVVERVLRPSWFIAISLNLAKRTGVK